MFGTWKLQLGEFFDIDGRRLGFDFRLNRDRRFGLGGEGRLRSGRFGQIPSVVGIDLRLAQAREVIIDCLLGVEAEVLGVRSDESAIEDAAGQLLEVFLFDGLQHARADLGDVGNVVERELFLLPRFTKFVAELAHVVKTLRCVLATS